MPRVEGWQRNRPRFFKEPSDEDIEANGWAMATVNARVRARIIGSRLMAGMVSLGIGTALTAQELLTNTANKPVDIIANFVIPAVINGVAEIKVERQLHRTAQEVGELLRDIPNINDNRGDASPPVSEA